MFTGGNIGIPVGSAVKRRIDGLCDDILLMYMIQPFCGSSLLFANLLGYPLAPTGAA
jgi:hypothetical protein